jgi:hypothetical protein
VRGDPYPYTYAAVANQPDGAAYEAHVDLGQGMTCFRFSKDDGPIHTMWSDLGEPTVDFSAQLSGQVEVTRATGKTRVEDASTLTLTPDPLLVKPAP